MWPNGSRMNRSLGFWKRFASCFTKVTQKTKRPTFHTKPKFWICAVMQSFSNQACYGSFSKQSMSCKSIVQYSWSKLIKSPLNRNQVDEQEKVQWNEIKNPWSEIKSKQNHESARELSAVWNQISKFSSIKVNSKVNFRIWRWVNKLSRIEL